MAVPHGGTKKGGKKISPHGATMKEKMLEFMVAATGAVPLTAFPP